MSRLSVLLCRVIALGFVALAGCGSPPSDVQPYELKYASLYSQLHPFSRADQRWIEHIESLAEGRLRIKPYWGGAVLSSEQNVLELKYGIVDIGMITPIYTRGGVPTIRAQGGFYSGVRTIEDQVTAFVCLMKIEPTIERELAGVRVLAVQGGNFPGVLTVDKPVRSLADFAGLRLRAPSENFALLRRLGADPVNLPMGEVYSALAKGVIDGVVTPADALRSLHLAEVGRYFTSVRVSRGAYPARAISQQSWDRLPDDLKEILERSLPVWQQALTEEIAKAEQVGLTFAREQNVEIFEFPVDEQATFDARFAESAREHAASLMRVGVDGLAILEKAQALVARINDGSLTACDDCESACP
jgi:TRAP-type C4-dicarboxylate transport system substrate-binding protein